MNAEIARHGIRTEPRRALSCLLLVVLGTQLVACGESGDPDARDDENLIERRPIDSINTPDRELLPVPAADGAILYFRREPAVANLDSEVQENLGEDLRETVNYMAEQEDYCREKRENLNRYRADETGIFTDEIIESTEKRLAHCEARLEQLRERPGAYHQYFEDYRASEYSDVLVESWLLWTLTATYTERLKSELLATRRERDGAWSEDLDVRSIPSLARSNPIFGAIFASVPQKDSTSGDIAGMRVQPLPGYTAYRQVVRPDERHNQPGGYGAIVRARYQSMQQDSFDSMAWMERMRWAKVHLLHWRYDAGLVAKDLANARVELNPVPFDAWYPVDLIQSFSISPDGRHLVIAALGEVEPGHGGRHDLFVSRRTDDGLWGEPRRLPLNTSHIEMSPWIAPDGRTLYFASDRPGGRGGLDIYRSRRQGEGWHDWSEPEPLQGVNTAEDESSLAVSASGEIAFLSAGPRGAEDIHEFPLPPAFRPDPVVFVQGIVRLIGDGGMPLEEGRTGEGGGAMFLRPMPLPGGLGGSGGGGGSGGAGSGGGSGTGAGGGNLPEGTKIEVQRLGDGKTVREIPLGGHGSYRLALKPGQRYAIHASAPGHAGLSQHVDTGDGGGSGAAVAAPLALVPLEVGQRIRLNSIFFEIDKAELLPESVVELNRLVGILERRPGMTIEVAGHTDAQADDAYNQGLSERRAKAVFDYLIEHGIDASRLEARGYGEHRPIASNATKAGRQFNRRVEFEILGL